MTEDLPLACTLGADDVRARMAWIADLNGRSLKAQRRAGLTLELTYAAAAAGEVARLVAQEQACCAFLAFDVAARGGDVVLTVTAPEAAREAADMLFAGLAAGERGARACGCC
ncbi:hypothetical protein [Phenylobacterium sp.]|uniref:hypothetical protein n=1 Tax=Phenylobacterium sp. TaxID=1871053 RepID=UPI0025F4BC3D|nr:hypothetical protein [Phenylobacterium sp.]